MKKDLLLIGIAVTFTGASLVAWHQSRFPQRVPPPIPGDLPDMEARLEASLKNPHPTGEQLLEELQLLGESALLANEDQALSAPPPPAPLGRSLPPAPESAKDPGYDLPALESRFLAAFDRTSNETRRHELQTIAAFLAERDPATATRFMQAILNTRDALTDGDGQTFATMFMERLAPRDPGAAATWAESLPEQLKYQAHQILSRAWAQKDPAALETWSATLQDPSLRSNVIRAMSASLATTDATGYAPGWAQRLARSPEDGPRMADVVVSHWAAQDLDSAREWASSLPADARESAMIELTRKMAAKDAPAAAAWAEASLDGDLRMKAVQDAVTKWAGKDPAAAAAWVDKIADPNVTDLTFDTVSIAWMRKDEARASAWVDSAQVPDHRKEYVHEISRQ